MIPKGLVISTSVGVVAGLIFGLVFVEYKDDSQLEFVEGSSISILTEKMDFKKGEPISITIINSGTATLTFSDASYGLRISQLDGILTYNPVSSQVISTLEPKEEVNFVWNQIKNDGEQALQGVYKISTSGLDTENNTVQKSITINIHK